MVMVFIEEKKINCYVLCFIGKGYMISTLDLYRQLNDQLILLTLIILPDPDKANNTIGITTSLRAEGGAEHGGGQYADAGQDIHMRAHSVSPDQGAIL